MKVKEFIKWVAEVKAKYGNLFRSGLRINSYPHEVYGWKAMAMDTEGNLMYFSGDHGSSNPEHVISVVDGVCYSTEHSNGRFQQACRTIYEGRDTAEGIVKVAYRKSVLAPESDLRIPESVKAATDKMIADKAKEQKAENKEADDKVAEMNKAKKDILSAYRFMSTIKTIHQDWFRWVHGIANGEDKDKNYLYVCQSGYGRGWNHRWSRTWFGYEFKKVCRTDAKPNGIAVKSDKFYKMLKDYLKKISDDPQVNRDKFCLTAFGYDYGFNIAYDAKTNEDKFFVDMSLVEKFPKDYPYRGNAWRDGLRQATEDEIKSTKTWVKVYGSGHALDVAMVNWKKKIWRHLTAAEMAA